MSPILNTNPGQAYLTTGAGTGTIDGANSTWTFIDTYPQVTLINRSKKTMNVGGISVVNTTVDPTVNLETNSLPLTFNIVRTVAPTLIDIESLNPDPPDVVVAGVIDNPIGTTRIVNPHASILSTGSRTSADIDPGSLIRTSILDLEAPTGSVGQASARVNVDVVDSAGRPPDTNFRTSAVNPADGSIFLGPNEFFTGQLVKYHAGGAVLGNLLNDHYYVVIASGDGVHIQLANIDTPNTPIAVTPTASPTDSHALTPAQRFTVIAHGDPTLGLGNAYLDVKARRRDNAGTHLRPALASDNAIGDYAVVIDAVNTTGNADLKLWGSVAETDTSGTTYPGGTAGHAGGILVVYAGHPSPGERHFTYFKPPPAEPPAPALDPGTFASAGTHINSTYDLRAFDSAGNLWRPGITSGRNIIITAAESNAADPKIVNVYGITEIVGGGSASSSDQHHIDVLTNGYVTLHEKTDDLRVGSITSTGSPSAAEPHSGDVTLFAPAAILDALNDGPGAGGDVTGRNITLTAGDSKITGTPAGDKSGRGGVGTPGNFLEVNENANGAPLGVLNATDTASATTPYATLSPPFDPAGTGTFGVFLTETAGDMEVDTVNTRGNASLATVAGSIVDARSGGVGDDAANVIGNTVNLFARGGNIGDPSGNNDLEIDSQAYAYGTIGARATGSVHLTETLPTTLTSFAPDAQVVLMQALGIPGGDAVGGDLRFTVREGASAPQGALTPPMLPTGKGQDLNLLASGAVLFLENASEALAHGLVNTPNGSVLLRVGDNVNTDPNAQILAGHNIDIYGDFARVSELSSGSPVSDTGDPGYGTVMQLHGVIAHGPTAGGYLTRVFGNSDADQFFFDQTFLGGDSGTASSPIPGGTSQVIPDGGFGVAGLMSSYSGGKARAYGSNTPSPAGGYAPAGDGEDFFVVNQLQSMVINQQTTAGVATDETLTLDGQSGSDTYVINTTGTHGDVRNYVVNVLDSGAPDDGVDNLSVYGRDTSDPAFNGPTGSIDDIFLLRRTTGIAGETPSRPAQYADDSGFVAVLDFDPMKGTTALAQAQASDPNADGGVRSESVQRVNYDSAVNGRLMVFGLGGNDYFAVDDNAAATTLDGGAGNDAFQVGQIYGLQRDGSSHFPSPLGNTFGGSVVTPYDQFPQLVNSLTPQSIYGTVATTRGWLSAGATSPLLAEGGTGDDSFTVYSNQAVVRLEGDDGNDLFTVRAFALAETDPVTGDIVWIDPVQMIAKPRLTKGFSTAAETNIRTGAGSNQVQYNINAPVSVDGGPGFDKLVILGTEFADHIVVTDKGVFGAGVTVTYQNIEVLEIDALEGDDTIDVLSTPPGMAVRVIGGLGNDTINVAGDVAGDVVSRDINGTSSTITDRITSADPAYDGLVAEGLSLSVARPDQGQVIIDEGLAADLSPGLTDVREGGPDDVYGIYLAHAPAPGTHVYVTVSAAMSPQEEHGNTGILSSGDIIDNVGFGDSILVSGEIPAVDYDRHIVLNGQAIDIPARAIVFVFDSTHWDKAGRPNAGEQTVHVHAVDDSLAEGDRTVTISHSVLSDDRSFNHAIVRNVEVTVHDNDQPGVVVTQLDPSTPALSKYGFATDNVTKVLEGDSVTEVTDLYAVELETKPTSGTVRVALNPQDNRVSLASSDPRFHTVQDPQPDGTTGMYYAVFDASNWNVPVLVTMHAVQRSAVEDPHDTTVIQSIDGANTTDTAYKNAATDRHFSSVVFADSPTGDTITRTDGGDFVADGFLVGQTMLVSGTTSTSHGLTNNAGFTIKGVTASTLTLTAVNTVIPTPAATTEPMTVRLNGTGTVQRLDALVIDDGPAGVFLRESGGGTLVSAGTASTGPGPEDTYQMRLTSMPRAGVYIDLVTDGQTDIDPTNPVAGGRITLAQTGGLQALQLFTGNITVAQVDAHTWTVTRASGSETGSWVNDGFLPGQTIRIEGTGNPGVDNPSGSYKIGTAPGSVTDQVLTLTDAGGSPLPTAQGTFNTDSTHTVAVDTVNQRGVYTGKVEYTVAAVPFLMFSGNVTITGGNTITRSDLGSFVNDNFAPGEWINVQLSNGSTMGGTGASFQIATVSDSQLTVSGGLTNGTLTNVSISKLLDAVRRTDGTSWLDSGFLEGQLVQITGLAGSPMLEKVDLITGTASGKLDLMVLTDHPASPLGPVPYSGRPLGGPGTDLTVNGVSFMQMAARVTYAAPSVLTNPDDTPSPSPNIWYKQVTVPLVADPYFDIQPGHENLRAFPKVPHLLSGIRGPLSVEGGTTSEDRSLAPAVLLPGEANAAPFNIPPQPPETQSIDVLNVYNDGAKGNANGTLTSTAVTGLGMGAGLDFSAELGGAHPYNEPGVYPGGISYGSISLVQDPNFPGDPSKQIFNTDGSHSTVEVVNLFLGTGNDQFTVNSTLIPGPDHNADGSVGYVSEHGGITTVHGGGNTPLQMVANNPANYPFGNGFDTFAGPNNTGKLVRTDGLPWVNDGFTVGQQVLLSIDGGAVGSYTILAIGNPDPLVDPNAAHKPGSVLTLLAAPGSPALTTSAGHRTGTISVTDQLAVVSGQVIGGQTTGNFDVQPDRIIRDDNLPWASLGFAAGQKVAVSVGGNVGTWTVLGFDNSASGLGSALLLSGPALLPLTNAAGLVAESGRFLVPGPFAVTASTLTLGSGTWSAYGFRKGQAVAIGGQPGYWLVAADPSGGVLKLQGADLTTLGSIPSVAVVRIGGDNINVNGTGEVVSGGFGVSAPVFAGSTPDPQGTTDRLTRTDGHTWNGTAAGDSAYSVGQQIALTGEWSFPAVVFARNAAGDTIRRTDGGSWLTDGFVAGETIQISGTTSTNGNLTNNGAFTIQGVTVSTLTLTAANTVVPTATTEPMTVELTGNFLVTGFANGGATLLMQGLPGQNLPRQAAVPMTVVVDAPLVVYGDTTQDGVWYNGKPYQTESLGKFNTKPQPHMDSASFTLATPSVGQTNPAVTLPVTLATYSNADGTFGTITRASGDWRDVPGGDHFLVGGLVTINNQAVGEILTLTATTLTLQNLTPAFASFGSGSLTVKEWTTGSVKLSGGQFDPGFVPEGLITLGATYNSVVFTRDGAGDTITRSDGGSWITDGFAAGQTIAVSGTAYNNVNFTLVGVTASTLRVSVANSVVPTPPATTESARITADIGTVAEVGTQYNITFSSSGGNKITRNDVGGSWVADGFAAGQTIAVYGTGPGGAGVNNQVYKILNVTASTLTVDKAVTAEGPENAILSGGATKRDTLFLVDLQPAFLALLGGNSSLTLQRTVVERNRLGQNADFFVFPLANQYTFDGNDVLDAHSLFATIPNGLLPAVGLTAYGGRGDDTVIGSATGDHLAGGSGNDRILGGRGVDHIYGDSGINVDVITRVLTVAQTAGNSGASNLDPLFAGNDLVYGDAPGSAATDVYGDYNDVVFGDLGDVGQAVSGARDTTKPIPLTPQRIETTLLARTITSQSRQNAADDIIYGNGGDDVLVGGAGNDSIDGGGDRDLVFGDSMSLSRAGHLGNFSNLRFETLQGTQIYSTAPATAGQDLASKVPQADPRGHGAWGDYVITLLDHADVPVVNSFGNDYLAGGPADDMVFGEMGNDTVQGDGSIDYVSHVLKDDGNGNMIPDPAYPIGGRVGVLNVAANYAGNPFRDASNALVLRPSFDAAGDGQDYVEGGGGNDILLGNQNQDDLIGGNSDLFSLTTPNLRPDGSTNGLVSGSDLIFGGSGTAVARNAIGDATVDSNGNITTTPSGHANDSDAVVGDNGDIIRLVGVNGQVAPPVGALVVSGSLTQAGNPVQALNGFLQFNYDTATYDTTAKIIPRAVRLLDYSPGGPDFNPTAAAKDIGAADEIHGENGDDTLYGQVGSDWLYGEGQNDDMIGGYGNDWMSGGTGDDGMIGDDGRIFTSRNSQSADPANAGYLVSLGEPLSGVAPLLPTDADPKYSNGNALNEFIFTPGNMQTDTINVSGALKKTVDLTPFSSDPNWNGLAQPTADEFSSPPDKINRNGFDSVTTQHYDDILFGGLGSDWIHGGSGDDAISGSEALPQSYAPTYDANGPSGLVEIDYYHPFDPGNVLAFQSSDPNSHHPRIAGRTGEFALYDENDPFREILLNANGTASKWAAGATPTGVPFFLNFNQNEGVFVPGGTAQQNGNQTVTYGPVHNDGGDILFGDNGNDWMVGGTGRDHMYGGWGNDLLNADDDLTTNGALNNVPETAPTYEDRAYGGAGKDVLIANTGGDRLIDWVGEYNSYLVPFSEFGMATVSRTLQPQLHYFLYAESLSDGVDATRFSDLNGGAAPPAPKNNDPNPGRNGEPAGELGLVLQQDAAWHGQTGAPTDPQAGNTPGTQRDVLRSASFSGNGPSAMFADTGTWAVSGGAYQNSAQTVGGDNVSLFDLNSWLPSYYEVLTTLKVYSGGGQTNGFIIFDYQGATDFKYAGIDPTNNLLKIGQRTAAGWADLAALVVKGLGLNKNNSIQLTANGTTATLIYNTYSLSYTFAGTLNTGMVGVGTNNSLASFTSYTVQKLPILFTYQVLEDFSDGVADKFTPQTGTWTTTSGSAGRYYATPPATDAALSTRPLAVAPLSYVEYSATVNAGKSGVWAGLVFDYTSANDFLYAAVIAGTNQVVLGHRSYGTWYVDATASANIAAGTDYSLLVALSEGTTNSVNVVLNGKSVVSLTYNYLVHDGGLGLLARNGAASFDNVLLRGDDVAYAGGGTPQLAAAPPASAAAAPLTDAELAPVVAAAVERWSAAPGVVGGAALLRRATFAVSDLPGLMVGQTVGNSIVIDPTAAGYGWFVDGTPLDDAEFDASHAAGLLRAPAPSPAAGRMDLLTVVMHELGHLLGRADIDAEVNPTDLMDTTLPAGVRRLPDGLASAPGAALPASGVVQVAALPPAGTSRDGQAVVRQPPAPSLVVALPPARRALANPAPARGVDAAFAALATDAVLPQPGAGSATEGVRLRLTSVLLPFSSSAPYEPALAGLAYAGQDKGQSLRAALVDAALTVPTGEVAAGPPAAALAEESLSEVARSLALDAELEARMTQLWEGDGPRLG